jgi:hypothetical protein
MFGARDALGGVRQILSGTRHGKALRGQVFPARNVWLSLREVMVDVPVTMLKSRKK